MDLTTTLSEADFRGANLAGSHWWGLYLEEVRLEEADLQEADFRGVHFWLDDLPFAEFHGKWLDGANFSSPSLYYVYYGNFRMPICAVLGSPTPICHSPTWPAPTFGNRISPARGSAVLVCKAPI